MIIHSDFHIHTEHSYDAKNSPEEIVNAALKMGLRKIGITDHLNFNDEKFLSDLYASAEHIKRLQKSYPFFVLGVELTPIEKPEFDYIAKHGTREGYIAPHTSSPYDMELGLSKSELMKLGVRYAIGAAHWRVDAPADSRPETDLNICIKEWYRQQMWLAEDERVTILGHPWYNGKGLWYEDFSVIPHSMNMDIAAVLLENKKYVECNSGVLCSPKASEKFRHQYAEFLRELFEMGIPVTYGSDSHKDYGDRRDEIEKYLSEAGFADGDISEISEEHLW